MQKITKYILWFAVGVFLWACGQQINQSHVPTPLGERQALEKLEQAYLKLSENMGLTPDNLTPAKKKQFVLQVFANAGYNYAMSLHQAAQGLDKNNRLHMDLIELLFYPHQKRIKPASLADIYTTEELADIRTIENKIRTQ